MITTTTQPHFSPRSAPDSYVDYLRSSLYTLIHPSPDLNNGSALVNKTTVTVSTAFDAYAAGDQRAESIWRIARGSEYARWIKSIRRRIHENTELAYEEHETSRTILQELDGLDVKYRSVANHDVHSVPDSPMLDTTSSFGSASSSPSIPNLPPIRVHVDEIPKVGALGIEEQFQQLSVGVVNMPVPQKQGDSGGFLTAGVASGAVVSGFPVVAGSEYANRVVSDDEISDHGGGRKVQQIQPQVQDQVQPQHIPQYHQKQTSVFDFPSPDSVSSEGSATNPLSRKRQMGDQMSHKVPMHLQQAQESGYMFSGQYDQIHSQLHQPQQFVHGSNQYIPSGAVPIASYYPLYPSHQQHQQHHPHQPMLG